MHKIPTIFKRDKDYLVTKEINPTCAWVFNDAGVAYRKWQGMAAMILGNNFYRRAIIKKNQKVPSSFILLDHDERTSKSFGWLPVNIDNQADIYYNEAYDPNLPSGTYELIGPNIMGNKEKFPYNILMSHKAEIIQNLKRTYTAIKEYISSVKIEGIVFHHEDGRMAKIKGKDFGLTR